jgi:hypothetical protein
MSDLFDSPADRWGLIFYSTGLYRRAHTRQEWAHITHAIAAADRRHTTGVRGDDSWCATAVEVYTQLRDADAYPDLRADGPPRWHADEQLIRGWLGAPTIPADGRRHTVLHDHGWNHTLDPNRVIDPADLTLLVDLAQDAGVVGEPFHKVSLLRWVQDGVFSDDSFLVVVWRPDGPALPGGPVRLDELTATGQTPTDRAVAVLAGVASVANRLLAAAEPDRRPARTAATILAPPDAVHEQPLRRGGRAFRLITGTADPSPPALPPPPAPPSAPRHPRT